MSRATTTTEYNNVTVNDALLVKGKQFTQEHEAVDLTVLDLATLNDVVVTGNQENDGTVLFNGPVQFDAPVSFRAPVQFFGTSPLSHVPCPPFTGTVAVQRQGCLVSVGFSLTNSSGGDVSPASVPLFTLPKECEPTTTPLAFVGLDPDDAQTVVVYVVDTELCVRQHSPSLDSTVWKNGTTRCGNVMYMSRCGTSSAE